MNSKHILISSLILLMLNLTGCTNIFFNERPQYKEDIVNEDIEEKEYMPVEIRPVTTPIPEEGVYKEPFRLQLNNSRKDATVYYTADMDIYNIEEFDKYELPILINRDTSIRFYSTVDSFIENIKEAVYKIDTTSEDSKDPYDGLPMNVLSEFIYRMDINIPELEISPSPTNEGIIAESNNPLAEANSLVE